MTGHGAEVPFPAEPQPDCGHCERLADFRAQCRAEHPDWHNGPVDSFGPEDARLLIVGLAPGLSGANKTGRPFTGDFAGDLLYATLAEFGFSRGSYGADPGDGLELVDCMITNAVRCVPPKNRPTGPEISNCRPFLSARMAALPRLAAVLALGRVAHDSTVTALGRKPAHFRFGHNHKHEPRPPLVLFDSYHCSRYNTNTGVLTAAMFREVFRDLREFLDRADA